MYSWKIIHGKHKRIALQSLIKGSSVSPGATPAYLIAMNIAAERSSCVTRRNEMRQMLRVCVILIDFLEIPSTTQWALFTILLLSLCKGLILYKSNGFCLSGSKANFSCTLHHAVIFQLYICSWFIECPHSNAFIITSGGSREIAMNATVSPILALIYHSLLSMIWNAYLVEQWEQKIWWLWTSLCHLVGLHF